MKYVLKDKDISKKDHLENVIYRFVKNYTKPFELRFTPEGEKKEKQYVYNYIAKRFVEANNGICSIGLAHTKIEEQFDIEKNPEEPKKSIKKTTQDQFNFNNSFENHMKALRN